MYNDAYIDFLAQQMPSRTGFATGSGSEVCGFSMRVVIPFTALTTIGYFSRRTTGRHAGTSGIAQTLAHTLDMRDRPGILALLRELRPPGDHPHRRPAVARPAAIPFDDFDTNAVGTLNLLEAARQACPEAPFIHMSTNKVYGDRPNTIP